MVTPSGTRAADILIAGDQVAALADYKDPGREGVILDVGGRLVLPGLVDFDGAGGEPRGKASGWSEKVSGEAAAGGVTTLVDLPTRNRPSSTSPRTFDAKLASAEGQLWVDCGFLGGLVPGSAGQVATLVDAGVLGIVAVLGKSSPEYPPPTLADLRQAMPTLARLGRPLLVLAGPPLDGPGGSEASMLRPIVALCRDHACRVHVLGLSTPEALSMVADARGQGLLMTAEVPADRLIAPNDPADLDDPSGLRAAGRDRLWDGLRRGVIDAIGSGHREPVGARSGSFRLALPRLWAEARARGFTPDDLARWMSRRPAEILGLGGRKGSVAEGADADFVIFDPDEPAEVDPGGDSPDREGRPLSGRVVATILRGQLIRESGRLHGRPQGLPLLRLDETEPLPNGLERLNRLSQAEALERLRYCCGSSRWAWRLLALRPFSSMVDLLDAADRVWATLDDADRIEAFSAHPRVSDRETLRPRSAPAGAPSPAPPTPAEVLAELAEADRTYEAKFEFPFLVADPELPAVDLLALLRQRLHNDPRAEFGITSWEQAEVTRQRLRALILGS